MTYVVHSATQATHTYGNFPGRIQRVKQSPTAVVYFRFFWIFVQTLLLALGWANVYLGLYAEGRKHDLQVLSDAMHAATAITRQEEPVGITLPSGEIAVLRSSGASPAAESLGGSSSAPDAASEDPEGILGGASGGSRQRSVNFISSVQDKAHDLLHVSTFVMLLIVTLSIVAVYSIADFAPALYVSSYCC